MAQGNQIRTADIVQKVTQIGAYFCMPDETLDQIVDDVNQLVDEYDRGEIPLERCQAILTAEERVMCFILVSFINATPEKVPKFLLTTFYIGTTAINCDFLKVFYVSMWLNTAILHKNARLTCVDYKNGECLIKKVIKVITELDIANIYFHEPYDKNMKQVRLFCILMQSYYGINMDKITNDCKKVVLVSTLIAVMTMTSLKNVDLKRIATTMNISTGSQWDDIHKTCTELLGFQSTVDLTDEKNNTNGIIRIDRYFNGYAMCGDTQLHAFTVESFSLCIVSFLFYFVVVL